MSKHEDKKHRGWQKPKFGVNWSSSSIGLFYFSDFFLLPTIFVLKFIFDFCSPSSLVFFD
ncbi:hypothetical protein HanRHA438_Chr11g0521561 [Helianthus annuus]|uniref:Uncharacterized protein n=1 Tax=Helianthus annuus TaxID=4232 RepID=A0A251TDY2_HELAN|nr:hypothetical protein HanXRQr2_Chr11g0509181 [Helianthus annuus]KAJ0518812.1 hypothetical protein HanHA89_Chr11g0441621 [Helianthus annuus]KAJ0686832.1 hypothetical protein HanLR1_Chr11g0419161 [Helianthus annuus]KAJ0690638.1 hypothetical protein HanOQP8_Chr11g0420071 [Helianthus annuus]KAJ0872245.1 hypothetical protein HanRHA438_Chr11g0521561 [Helianthus annuus]